MGWDGMGWDGMGCDGVRWDRMMWGGMGWDGMAGRDRAEEGGLVVSALLITAPREMEPIASPIE